MCVNYTDAGSCKQCFADFAMYWKYRDFSGYFNFCQRLEENVHMVSLSLVSSRL